MEKIQKVEIRVHRGRIADLGDDEKRWMAAAIEAAKKAYAPYSCFQVGAVAVLEDGTFVSGRRLVCEPGINILPFLKR